MKMVIVFVELLWISWAINLSVLTVFVSSAIHLLMKSVLVFSEKMSLPMSFLCLLFEYLNDIDLIEVSAVCKYWNFATKTARLSSKLKETNELFKDRDWLLKTYRKQFEVFRDDIFSLLKQNYLKESTIQFYLFKFGTIFGVGLDLSGIRTFPSFAQCLKSKMNDKR